MIRKLKIPIHPAKVAALEEEVQDLKDEIAELKETHTLEIGQRDDEYHALEEARDATAARASLIEDALLEVLAAIESGDKELIERAAYFAERDVDSDFAPHDEEREKKAYEAAMQAKRNAVVFKGIKRRRV